jgi:hypothetical protein
MPLKFLRLYSYATMNQSGPPPARNLDCHRNDNARRLRRKPV